MFLVSLLSLSSQPDFSNLKIKMMDVLVPDPLAREVDVSGINWHGMWAYTFPPLPLIPKVLRNIWEKQEIILVAP